MQLSLTWTLSSGLADAEMDACRISTRFLWKINVFICCYVKFFPDFTFGDPS